MIISLSFDFELFSFDKIFNIYLEYFIDLS